MAEDGDLERLQDDIGDVLDGNAGGLARLPTTGTGGDLTDATVSAVAKRVRPGKRQDVQRLGPTLLAALEEERIIGYLLSRIAEERAAAAELLAVVGSGKSRIALTPVKEDDLPFVQRRASEALDRIGERKRERKKSVTKEKSSELKAATVGKSGGTKEWRFSKLRSTVACESCGREIPVRTDCLHLKGQRRYFHVSCRPPAAERRARIAREAMTMRVVQGGLPTLGRRR